MRIARPMALIFVIALALALPRGHSHEVFAQAECVQPLDSVTVEGTWNDDCLSRNREDAYARYYTFSMLQQAEVTITLESETDPYVFLLSGTGVDADYLAENDDIDAGSRNFNSRITITLEPEDYTIEATTYEQPAIGDFTLTVRGVGPLDDRAALVAFYHATGGDNWEENENWLTDAPLGDWYGINTVRGGRVVDLDLGRNDLTGHIPPELGELSELESLELGGNLLTGTLPPELGELSKLEYVELGGNLLTGALPPELGKLTELEDLELDGNLLTGTLPPELGKLVNMTHFSIEGNYLTGTIPPEIGSLASLEIMVLIDNRFWGELPHSLTALSRLRWLEFDDNSGLCAPADAEFQEWLSSVARVRGDACVQPASQPDEREIAALTAIYNATDGDNWFDRTNWLSDEPVQFWSGISVNGEGHIAELRLWGNNLSGQIPTELSHLTSLKRLYLGSNQFTGTIPAELGLLTELERLYLGRNQLTGTIPSALGNLTGLKRLYLYDNQMTGSIPPELSNLTALELLYLYDNNLTGSLPSELGDLHNLEELFLSRNELTGPIPPELGNMKDLLVLRIFDNRLDGSIPPELSNLGSLEGLNLSGNRLTGQIPPVLVNLSNLSGLSLDDNQLTGEIPHQFGAFRNLSDLSLDDNHLTGSIPQSLGNLTTLWSLRLSGNQLSSEIPRELGFLHDLHLLDLSGNQLTGTIPTEFGKLPLSDLNLSGNRLEGTIPTEFGKMLYMNRLDLSDNQLTGPIPAELRKLGVNSLNELQILLGNNQITGPVPPELGNLTDLEILEINDNRLTGQLPYEFTNLGILDTLYFNGNDGLCAPGDAAFQDWLKSIAQVRGDTCVSGSEEADRAALTALYNSTNGDNWTDNTNWLTAGPLSEWYGVTTDEYDRVTRLSLEGNELTGTITPKLANLANLELLEMEGNELTGDIPSELGNLVNLRLLSFDANKLTGTIPPELGRITNLENLHLAGNELAGAIPSELGNLSNLLSLAVARNQLTGAIPPDFGDLGNLKSLWLDNNQLSGTIPSDLGNLANLELLRLHNNQLTDSIPPEMGNLSKLKGLHLNQNQLTGVIPRELANLTNLEYLNLGSNQFNGPLPSDLAGLSNLRHLSLSGNQLTGEIPSELGNLVNLGYLSLGGNQLTGGIPSEISYLNDLSHLSLDSNQLTGGIPPELGNLSNLTWLSLAFNQLTGGIPSELSNLTLLEELNLQVNQLTGTIPSELDSLDNLTGLLLYVNNLTGPIPPELGRLDSLQRVGLSGNQLTGQIPPELGNLGDKLIFLWLDRNLLSGPIPAEFVSFTSLRDLNLNGNQLMGEIPPELGNLPNLGYLKLNGNRLTGEIPSTLGRPAYLTILDLGANQLTGTIPPELGNLTRLEQISLGGNDLMGCIPYALRNVERNDFDDLGLDFCDDTDSTPSLSECVDPLPDDMTIEGTWNTDCTSNVTAPRGSGDRYARFYTFTLEAESDVTITLNSDEDAYLYLRIGTSTDDSPIHENDDIDSANGDYNSRIEETLAPNTYTIETTTYAAGVTGDFILEVKIEGQPPTTDCTDYSEAPNFAEKVASGELPSVCDRMPSEPVVIPALDDTGEYGGILRRFYLGQGDGCNFFRLSRASLVRFSQDGFSLLPSVARDWEMSDDGKEWTFYLREGMKWSDGDDFNADDFVWQYENVLLNEDLTPDPTFFLRIGDETGRIEKVDDTTVKFVFPQPNFLFLEIAAQADEACYGNNSWKNVPWAPAHYMQQFHIDFNPDANTMAQDGGFEDWTWLFRDKGQAGLNPEKPTLAPWKFTNPLGDQLVMSERNPYFWAVDEAGNQLPYLDGIQLTLVESIELGILSAVQGEIDMQARHIQLDQFPPLKEGEVNGGYTLLTWPAFGGSDVAFFFNMSLPGSTGDAIRTKEFRQALSLAIDRWLIQEVLFLGFGEIRQSVPPPGHPHYPGDDIAKLRTEYDPDAANALLDEVFPDKDNEGFRMNGDERIVMDITVTDTYSIWSDAAQVVGRAWEAIGVKTDVSQTTRTLHFTRWQTNEWAVMVSNEDTAGFTFNSIGKRAPEDDGSFHGPGCGLWLQTGGREGNPDTEGFPCPQESLDLLDMHRLGPGLPEAERNALGKEIYKTIVENQYNIGIVGLSPMVHGVVVKKNTLHNVPDTAANDWILRTPNTAFPEQWYFKPATEP